MVNEIEDKKVAVEDVKESGESKPAISALELLGGAAAAGAASAADGKTVSKDLVGKLEITDEKIKTGDSLKDLLGSKEILGMKERPLSKTEQLILGSMQEAIKTGNVDKIQDMLGTLAENPGSVNRVLRELNERMQKENPLNSASWEQGTDSNGNNFVRLRMYHMDSFSKSAGGTEVTIGSDGRNSATRREMWNSPAEHVDPSAAMYHFGGKQHFLPHYDYDTSGYKKQI